MIVNQDEPTLSPEEKTMTDKLVAIDFSKIPSTEELDKMKVKPKNR
jgi:hypothetical protein